MSNTEKTMVILWIAISFILSASGQTNYIFRNINIQHGLPDNQIKGLFLSPPPNPARGEGGLYGPGGV